ATMPPCSGPPPAPVLPRAGARWRGESPHLLQRRRTQLTTVAVHPAALPATRQTDRRYPAASLHLLPVATRAKPPQRAIPASPGPCCPAGFVRSDACPTVSCNGDSGPLAALSAP